MQIVFKPARTKALYAGSFDPITRGHLDIILKALRTFDAVHVAIGTNVRKQRAFPIRESLALIARSIQERWDGAMEQTADSTAKATFFGGALEIGEYENQSLIKYAHTIGATHIVRGLREASNFTEEFNLHGVAERIDPSLPMVHFICEAQFFTCRRAPRRSFTAWAKILAGWSCPAFKPPLTARSLDFPGTA